MSNFGNLSMKMNLHIYSPAEIADVLPLAFDGVEIVASGRGDGVYNCPCSFDIETTSTTQNGEKIAFMYEWTLNLNGFIIIGRTWAEFLEVCEEIEEFLTLSQRRRLIIYVHNLAFEFSFMAHLFTWAKVFAIKARKPVYAITGGGIEFRCSYILSGQSLETVGKNLQKYKVEKATGDLDYSKIRHSGTPLTDTELGYCVRDVQVVESYIRECIENDGNITKIPLTKTGYVRRYCRGKCLSKENAARFSRMIRGLTLTADEYTQLKRAFQGGFTHAGAWFSGQTIENVVSYDICSSYPAVMVAEKFPMSKGKIVKIENRAQFEQNCKKYCCVFDVKFEGLKPRRLCESYISLSRCGKAVKPVINNGRVVSADEIITTITNIDYEIIKEFYTWERMAVGTFRRYYAEYLPTPFVESILQLYADKTTLKNVPGKETDYSAAKSMLNAAYGMTVTDIYRENIIFEEEWKIDRPDIDEEMKKYNQGHGRFLFYPWGVFVTAYARRNLFRAIMAIDDSEESEYIYSDTDSVKYTPSGEMGEFFESYNNEITAKIETALKHHGLPLEYAAPKTIKGVKKPLGVYELDGEYKRFKTLGAKRYMVEYKDTGEISITVSGVNKRAAVPWLLATYGREKVFDAFKDSLLIPAENTGKLCHTYIDEEKAGEVVDYLGNRGTYHEKSAVHLGGAPYLMSIGAEYMGFLMGYQVKGVL